jgi:hypothetical protein
MTYTLDHCQKTRKEEQTTLYHSILPKNVIPKRHTRFSVIPGKKGTNTAHLSPAEKRSDKTDLDPNNHIDI